MSKRLGNIVDPFKTIEQFGADATRWYLITNASPWESMKFDIDGIKEVQRKFFGTLYNYKLCGMLRINISPKIAVMTSSNRIKNSFRKVSIKYCMKIKASNKLHISKSITILVKLVNGFDRDTS